MRIPLAVLLLGGVLVGPTAAQQPSPGDLKKDIESLRETLKAMQKDLQDIKAMLSRPAPPASGINVVVDLASNPVKGEPTAKLTLVEFSDYQWPFCAKYVRETYPQIDAEYVKTGKLKVVFLDMPLEGLHKLAFKAAEAANCAGEQGKYWEMHGRLFASQAALEPWTPHAEAVGLDVARFEQCLESGKFAAEIRRDMQEGAKAGVTGTPAFFLALTEPGSSKVKTLAAMTGARPFAAFKAEIDRLLTPPARAQADPLR